MRGFCGSMLNTIHLMRSRMYALALLLVGLAITAYLIGDIAPARNLAQLGALILIPMLTIWTVNCSNSSKWNIFEQSWSTSSIVMIVSRYVLFALINLIVSFLWYLSPIFDGDYRNLVHTIGAAYLALSIYYPMLHLLKAEKGELGELIFIISILGSIFGLGWFSLRFGTTFTMLLVVGIYIISLGLSVGFSCFHKGKTTWVIRLI